MGETLLTCTRCTGLGTPEYRLAKDTVAEGKQHTYSYGYFGFDRTSMGCGVRITNIHTFTFYGRASRSDTDAGVVDAFLAPLDDYFTDQAAHPPAVSRSKKLLPSQNALLPTESGHSLTDRQAGAVTDESTIEKIVRNGVALCVENEVEGTTATLKAYSNNSAQPPALWAVYEPVELKVKKAEVQGTKKLVPGFWYSFNFETGFDAKCVLGEVTQQHAYIGYEFGPSSSENIHDIGAYKGETFLVPAATAPGSPEPYTPWVYVISNSGRQSEKVYAECETVPLSLTIDDIHPSVAQYVGMPVAFSWTYKYSLPAGATGGSASQLKAEIWWRKSGAPDYTVIGGIGSAMGATVMIDTPGTIQYKIVSWDSSGGRTESAEKTFENKALAIKAADLYPAEGAKAPSGAPNHFGWRVVPDEDPEFSGQLTVRSAVFHWRPTGGTGSRTINAGTANGLTVPAGTFPQKGSIDWWVVLTASTGGVAASEPITLETADALSKPVPLSPVGQYVDDDPGAGILFTWKHGIETGTQQQAWELYYSVDGVAYSLLGSGAGGTDAHRTPYGSLPAGTVYWRLRTKNTDGDWGDWSEPATIVVRRTPETPRITRTVEKPLPRLEWQSKDQEGFRVTIGDFDTGWVVGTDTTYLHSELLPDGAYPATVRIITPAGLESAPACINLAIQNVPFAPPEVHVAERGGGVQLRWKAIDGAAYYVLRDGVPVLRTAQPQAWDWFASGLHTYVIRAMKDGYYADSKPVPGLSRVENAVLSARDPVDWIALSVKRGDRPSHDENAAGQVEFRHFYGRALPVAYDSGFVDAASSQSWTLPAAEAADYGRLQALLGKPAVYKDCFGRVRFGVLTSVDGGLTEDVELSLSFTQTDYEERVSYAEDRG